MRFHLVTLALATALAAGCSADDDGPPPAPPHARTAIDVEAARAARTGAAPGAQGTAALIGDAVPAKQLPRDVKEALKGEIEPWLFAWRVGLGTFRVDELSATGTRPLALDRLEPFDGNAPGEDLRLLHLALPSPGGTTLLDPYVDWTLSSDGTNVRAERDGDPAVTLIDLRSRVRQRLFDARPPQGRIDGAIWLDEKRFVVFAAERFEANPWRGGPVLYLVDLAQATVTRYEGPPLEFDGFKLVEKDLERRFRKSLPDVLFSTIGTPIDRAS